MSMPPINFDHHAHTPLDPQVREVLRQALESLDVNVHAASAEAEAGRLVVDVARRQVAGLLGASPSDVVFTSGATEANNLALLGLAQDLRSQGRTRIVLGAGEHPSVLEAGARLSGFDVRLAPLTPAGDIDLQALDALITPQTGLVSIAAANHEVGVLQPLAEISRLAHAAGSLFHSDLAQSAGRLELDLTPVDLASVSAHKLHGPLGVGALLVRRPVRRRLQAQVVGGRQEAGLRAGTLPAPLCVAFGTACELAATRKGADARRVAALRDRLLARLSEGTELFVNGRLDRRLPNNLNLRFVGVDAEGLVMHVRDRLSIATGSACTSRSLEPSHVLLAMGLDRAAAESSIRIGLGRDVTPEEVDAGAAILIDAVAELSALRRRRRA